MAPPVKAGKKETTPLDKPQLIVYFQSTPGNTHLVSGIKKVPYKLRINGSDKTPPDAKTDDEGKVSVPLQPGAKIELEIFGTVYEITYLPVLASYKTTAGVQQRLAMLGYHPGPDDKPCALTERATLEFQADNGSLAIDGVTGSDPNKSKTMAALDKLVKDNSGE